MICVSAVNQDHLLPGREECAQAPLVQLLCLWVSEPGAKPQTDLFCCIAEVRFNQTLSLVLERGKIAELQCEQNTNYDYMYRYQQLQGKGLHLIYYSYDPAKVEPGNISERFTAIRLQIQLFQLKISPVKPEDSAVYFCTSSLDIPLVTVTNNKVYFGAGTKLTVLEDGLNITSPKVAIFPPSKQEIKEKGKATLVCLVRDFYPDHVKLVWQVNDADREDGVRTDEFSTWDDTSKSYSLTSRLRISTQEWFNSKNSFRCAVKFHLDEVQYEVIRGGDGE
uniref:Ig-like domain-containing protein n=1 Tax=Chelonoidis abingdonii TaxID=106734 RepID=A0A8C0HBQ3_CHEAB